MRTSYLGQILLVLFSWTTVSNLLLLEDQFNMSCMSNTVHEGLEHCITAPVGTERNPLIVDDDIFLSRSTTGKWEFPRQDTILDRLSEKVKVLQVLLYVDDFKFQACVSIFLC